VLIVSATAVVVFESRGFFGAITNKLPCRVAPAQARQLPSNTNTIVRSLNNSLIDCRYGDQLNRLWFFIDFYRSSDKIPGTAVNGK